MPLKHATKRIFSHASTRQKTIDKGLNQEFVDSRRRLDDISGSLKTLVKSIQSSKQQWIAVAQHHRDFTKALASTFPEPGPVHEHADEVELHLRNVQQTVATKDSPDSPHQQLLNIISTYLGQIDALESEYKQVEVRFTEKQRYEHKVSKLSKKKSSDKISSKLQRNIEKQETAQGKLDTQLSSTLEKMRVCFNQHQVILQCAHHSYWMANYYYSTVINHAVHNIQEESIAVHNQLLGVNVEEKQQLMPIPRLKLIEEYDGDTNDQQGSVTVVVDPTVASMDDDSRPNSPSPVTPVDKQIPTVTSKNGTQLNIPDLPSELPKPPTANIQKKIETNASPASVGSTITTEMKAV